MNFTSGTSGLSAVSYYLFVYLGESKLAPKKVGIGFVMFFGRVVPCSHPSPPLHHLCFGEKSAN